MNQEYIDDIIRLAEMDAEKSFRLLADIAYHNQKKVLDSFRKNRISTNHFQSSTGYGYDDIARDTLGRLFSDVFGTESSIVSPLIVNGTHALTLALFGILRPNDVLYSITGKPYDTLDDVISGENNGSLKEFGIGYLQTELNEDGTFRMDEILRVTQEKKPKLFFIQRSKGYAWRKALTISQIADAVSAIKSAYPGAYIMVDNCYGEFVEKHEPTEVGADIIVGSLIKNIGGGIAPTGGYISGRASLVEQISYRLTAPSLGMEVGSYAASYLPFYQGLFLAPAMVKNALMGNVLAGFVFQKLGYDIMPKAGELPSDIIQSIRFRNAEEMVAFCQCVQTVSPVDSHVTPMPWDMPGYNHKVIMAAGTFIQGASLELTADGTVREPFIAYLQGGLTYEHCRLAIAEMIGRLIK